MMLRRLTVHPHLRLRFNSIDHYAFHHSVFRAESTLEKPTLRISPPPPPRVGENLFDNDGRNDQDIESMATNIVQHALLQPSRGGGVSRDPSLQSVTEEEMADIKQLSRSMSRKSTGAIVDEVRPYSIQSSRLRCMVVATIAG
jgi:hypothetical protein